MKILKIDEQEILYDYQIASDIINNCVNNSQHQLSVTGCCKKNNNIFVLLEKSDNKRNLKYIFAPLPSETEEELVATIRSRYDSGFTTITKFDIFGTSWGLFSKCSL